MSHMKSAKLAKIQSTYVPPVFNCANNLNETINDYDSIIIVSNDLKSLPEFPHTNALNEILEVSFLFSYINLIILTYFFLIRKSLLTILKLLKVLALSLSSLLLKNLIINNILKQ